MENISISYATFTRGYHDEIQVENREVEFHVIAGDAKSMPQRQISNQEWENIQSAMNQVNIENLSSYEAPSTDSYSDKGKAAVLKIEKNGTTYSSVQFDASNPPQKLKPLIEKLTALVEK